jgi:hypothetical protein
VWVCPKCGEKLDDQFDSCWKCAGESNPIGRPSSEERFEGLSSVFKISVVFIAFIFQFTLLAPSLATNLAKVPYRQKERFEAMEAYAKDHSPEKKAVFEEEDRKAIRYVTREWLVQIGIPFAGLLILEGIGFYYLLWHDVKPKKKN